jgi:hypothetical protein
MSAAATSANGDPVPPASVERILRRLFWQLLLRGCVATKDGKKPFRIGLAGMAAIYVLIGGMSALGLRNMGPLPFATMLHSMTLMFASLSLATGVGQMLFVREESEILLHRPIRPEQLLRAKVHVLVVYSVVLAMALNLISWIVATFCKGFGWRWLLAHGLSTTLLMVASAAGTVLVYQLCLRWFGRERLDNLLATMQALMAIVMAFGSQLVPRLAGNKSFAGFTEVDGLLLLAPPVWFGAFDAWLCGAMPTANALLPVALAVGVTAVVFWLAFGLLARSFGQGLMALHEGSGIEREHTADRRLGAIVNSRFLRWWMGDPVERHGFVLASAYLLRDRETKLKVLPGIAPLVCMPLLLCTGPSEAVSSGMALVAIGYLAIVPMTPMTLLQRSEQWRAAELLRAAPLPHWSPLFHGARKAVLLWLVLPSTVMVLGLLWLLTGNARVLTIGGVFAATLPLYTLVPGLFSAWLPLSEPNQAAHDMSQGCLTAMLTMGCGAVYIGALAAAEHFGWFWPVAVAALAISALLHWAMLARVRSIPWPRMD